MQHNGTSTDIFSASRDAFSFWTPSRGDSVTFKGSTVIPRSDLEDRALQAGLQVCGVVKHADVLVDGDPASYTGKAKTADQLGVPVVTETQFIEMLGGLGTSDELEDEEETVELSEEAVEDALDTALGLLGYLSAIHGDLRAVVQAAVERVPGEAEKSTDVEALLQKVETDGSVFQEVVENRYGTVQSALALIWDDCDDREEFILRDRLAADDPSTLEGIAQLVGVTRERVRQLQKNLVEWLDAETARGPVADLITALCAHAYPVAPLENLTAEFPVLTEIQDGWEIPVAQVLTGFSCGFDIRNGWLCFPDYDTATTATSDLLEPIVNEEGVAALDAVLDSSTLTDVSILEAWLVECGYVIRHGHVLTRTRTHALHAAGLLSVAGRPMTATELAELMPQIANEASFRNALSAADDIVRVGMVSWGLQRWGMEEYTDIADLIGRRIDAATDDGGTGVALSDLTEELSTTFGVSPKSVTTYANTGEFISKGGVICRRDTPQNNNAIPEESRALYLYDGRWRYLMPITKDHLRGSGSTVPNGLTSSLDLTWNEPVTVPSPYGEQKITWGNIGSSTIGSVRHYAEDLGLGLGDRVWVDLHGGEKFSLTPPRSAENGLTGLAWLADHIGADSAGDDEELYGVIATAIGYESDAPRRKILARFRHRLDREAVAVLEDLWM